MQVLAPISEVRASEAHPIPPTIQSAALVAAFCMVACVLRTVGVSSANGRFGGAKARAGARSEHG